MNNRMQFETSDFQPEVERDISHIIESQIQRIQEFPELEGDIWDFVSSSINGTHSQRFNWKSFDSDNESGLDALEYSTYISSLSAAIDSIILLGSVENFEDILNDYDSNSLVDFDKWLARKINLSTQVPNLDGMLGYALGLDNQTIDSWKNEKFSWANFGTEECKKIGALMALEISGDIEGILKIILSLPSCILVLPEYLSQRTIINLSSSKEERGKAELIRHELVSEFPGLAILELIGPKLIDAVKELRRYMLGTLGDISKVLCDIISIILGATALRKIHPKTGETIAPSLKELVLVVTGVGNGIGIISTAQEQGMN